nr:hypothetical protein MACL_00002347 [Theileria orientalis]
MIRQRSFLRALQSFVSSGQIPTLEYLESFEPKSLRRLKVFDETPPEDFRKWFFERLTSHYSNPRSILRSPRDRQALVSLPLFKYLIFDLIERKHFIHDWRLSTLALMVGCLVKLGFDNTNTPENNLHNIISLLLNEVETRDPADSTPFDWALLSYSLVLTNRYEWPDQENAALPLYLSRACRDLNLENLPLSGWTQYYLYMTLYCADVEKPRNESEIKRSIPFHLQESLYTRLLNEILIHAQPQGSEMLQKDVDTVLEGMGNTEALINCSVGRPDDEQHCLFAGHLFPNRRLCLEYNYLLPHPDGTPVEGGLVSFRRRLFNKLGYNTAVIHRFQWDALTVLEKEEQLLHILSKFPVVESDLYDSRPEPKTFEDSNYKYLKHLRPRVTTWPPDKISV